MKELVFLLEEESAKAMLESLLPRMLGPEIHPRLIAFEGKQDLEKQIAKKMRGYLNPQVRFIVMRDQDATPDCRVVKRAMISACQRGGRESLWLVRIACQELESAYLADLAAVESGLQLTGLAQQKKKQNSGHWTRSKRRAKFSPRSLKITIKKLAAHGQSVDTWRLKMCAQKDSKIWFPEFDAWSVSYCNWTRKGDAHGQMCVRRYSRSRSRQKLDPGCARNSISSFVDSRPRITLRCG